MKKQELINEINKTKEHLANMEKMLAECEYERWKPSVGEGVYFIDCNLEIRNYTWYECNLLKETYLNYGCFQTREQAEAEAEKILVRRMLEGIARRLNKGEEITWSTMGAKYFLLIDCDGKISTEFNSCITIQGVVYCLDQDFLDVAIQEIGEERLKKYLRGE